MGRPLEAALRRQRAMTILALAVMTLLAWTWLLLGAGMTMPPYAALDVFPHRAGDPMGMADAAAGWSLTLFSIAFSMWWVMMIAMMVPAAAPVILLYAKAAARQGAGAPAPIGHFAAGYLAVWGLFAIAAAGVQMLLAATDMLEPITMDSAGKWFSAVVLIAAGLYQLSPVKETCLRHCNNPAVFLSRHYRPGRLGAFRLGLLHGAWCVGCCWLLMALLFVGGVMNLAWIALLTLLVAAEKLLAAGRKVALAAGLVCIAWGAATAFA